MFCWPLSEPRSRRSYSTTYQLSSCCNICSLPSRLLVIYLLFASGFEMNPGPAVVASQPPLANFDLRGQRIIATSGDGHYFLHALRASIRSYLRINISKEFITMSLRSEVDLHYDNYRPFISGSRHMFLA